MEKIDKMIIINIHTSSLAAILTAFLPPSSFLQREEGGGKEQGEGVGERALHILLSFLGARRSRSESVVGGTAATGMAVLSSLKLVYEQAIRHNW